MSDLQIEATLRNEYGEFNVIANEMNTRKSLVKVTLIEDTPFAEKGDSSWVDINKIETKDGD